MLITRVKPAIYMSGWMIIWAVISGEYLSFAIPTRYMCGY